MISKNGLKTLEKISDTYGDKHINKFGMNFLLKILKKDNSTLSETEKIKKIENYVLNSHSEYSIALKYNVKPNNLIKELYNISEKYNVNFYAIKELYDRRDEFNFTHTESLQFIKKELELLSNERINLLYKGHESDGYWYLDAEYNERSKNYKYYINDTIIKKYRLFFYNKYKL